MYGIRIYYKGRSKGLDERKKGVVRSFKTEDRAQWFAWEMENVSDPGWSYKVVLLRERKNTRSPMEE